jgi:hypothetical protein
MRRLSHEEFSALRLADGEIVSINDDGREIRVILRDWEERAMVLAFREVLWFEGTSPCGVDLSLAKCDQRSAQVLSVCKAADESPDRYVEFDFVGAWSDDVLLAIVATEVWIEFR